MKPSIMSSRVQRVDVWAPVATPFRLCGAACRYHVVGHDKHNLVVLSHPAVRELASQECGVEMHAGQRSEYERVL